MDLSLHQRSPLSCFRAGMKDLLLEGRYSDMKITCKGFTFNVHRAIICHQSRVFEAALSHDFQEAATQTVDLPNDDLETIERVISYLYIQDYEPAGHIVPLDRVSDLEIEDTDLEETQDSPDSTAPDKFPVDPKAAEAYNSFRVYMVAEKYQIKDLQVLAAEKFALWGRAHWKDEGFLNLLPEVLTAVPPHDTHLLEAIADIISDIIHNSNLQEKVIETLEYSGCVSFMVMAKLLRKGMIPNPAPQKSQDTVTVKQIAQTLNRCTKCAHCSNPFYVIMLGHDQNRGAIRCRLCRERQ
ncbi:hypothetical protein BO71DRAFT_384223 [Aspergillus ellipticus CBS 707.79]|uniref:BTB domain-containing protein n=1 Tax=Aspergillus ellipticus CBS 707.79 TaxID=1448320 RepID=A0A319EMF9_9EURO|nr:hypothetical protein BO71DRAFT_384223 [Aspergillus ellipticus CBS 707.79]